MKTFTIGLIMIVLAGMLAMTRSELNQTREQHRQQRIESYNAGFRAGAMDILAQLVECEGRDDEVTLNYYNTAVDTLARLGELDDTPYPCYE